MSVLVCYERGWEAQKRNEEATAKIRRLFARYRAEAERARPVVNDATRAPTAPAPDVRLDRDDDRELVLR